MRLLDNSIPRLDNFYRAVMDTVMRRPRIMLRGLAERLHIGHAGTALLVKELLLVGALRADVQPVDTFVNRVSAEWDVELLAADLPLEKMASLLE